MSRPDPDYRRLRKALLCQGEPDRVPVLELLVSGAVKDAFMGRPLIDAADDVQFWYEAGYDACSICPGYNLNPDHVRPREGLRNTADAAGERTYATEGVGFLTSWEEFERFRWPTLAEVGFGDLDYACESANLPDGMQVIARAGDIFTHVWEFMGFEVFSYALVEQPDLVAAIFDRIGSFILSIFEVEIQYPNVCALWYSDDIAYNSGTLCSPAVLREHLFPWMAKIGALARQIDVPFIYHTDGDTWQVMDDLLACGIDALHPLEPKSMDAVELKRKLGDRLCLVGGVEMDRLVRGTPEEIDELARWRIETLAPGGGYCLGSSNTIADYIPVTNYRALLAAAARHGRYPLGN